MWHVERFEEQNCHPMVRKIGFLKDILVRFDHGFI